MTDRTFNVVTDTIGVIMLLILLPLITAGYLACKLVDCIPVKGKPA